MKGRGVYCRVYCDGPLRWQAYVDKQTIDRVELAVLLSLIGGGLALCVLGASVYDIGRAFSVW